MDAERDLTPADRVVLLLRHLGIARAHFLLGADVAAARPAAAASLALVVPNDLDAAALRTLAVGRTLAVPPLVIHDEGGRFASAVPAVLAAYPGLVAVPLRGYPALLWSDTI